MSDLAERIAKLSPAKRELLARRLRVKPSGGAGGARLARRARGGDLARLSYGQQWLWFLDQLDPGSPAYNLSAAVRLEGRLDAAALERGLNELVRRHEVLRTTFVVVEGEPAQRITPALALSVPLEDLGALPPAERELEVRRRASAQAQHSFDLAKGPLLRMNLLRLDREEHVLLLALHHIIADGWSLAIFIRELAALYEGFAGGREAALPELPVQYADFAEWQRASLDGGEIEAQLDYWQERLADAPAVLELPADRPRPAVQSFRGARQSLLVTAQLADSLRALGRREGATLFMTLLTAFQVLLARYTRQGDILVGTPVAGRSQVETEGLIGLFANTLVLRTSLDGDPTFLEALARVRETALGAFSHQSTPFERLVERLQPERSLSHNPVFQVLFALQNTPPRTLDLPGLRWSPLKVETHTSRFDLALDMREEPEGISGLCEYNTDLFEAETVARMMGHFQTLLAGIAADPWRRLSSLPLLTEPERARLLSEWSRGAGVAPGRQCLHELFEAQAARTPEAVAVTAGKDSVNYGELNRRSNQLAHYLRGLGVGPDVHVGVAAGRGVTMVTALLGVLKAGGAYLPFDPAYPRERLAFMLEDARAPLLLTTRELMPSLPSRRDTRVVELDSVWETIALGRDDDPPRVTTPDCLAYTIYTSGSTGRPKGVQVSHASVVSLFAATADRFAFGGGDVWTVVHSSAFDFSVWEIWGCLSHGGRLVVVPLEVARSPEALCDLLRDEGVTVLNQTPSAMRQLLDAAEQRGEGWRAPSLRLIVCGGEALPREVARRASGWGVPVWNFYGPTEATVWATAHRVEGDDADRGAVPIGRPLANAEVYVLDSQMRLVPAGTPGELYLGGDGLARGYLNRPGLTAERMRPHPFGAAPGRRLYRTGDLARHTADGVVEFLERIDQQVKVRGFRVELEEIEAVLAEHPGVGACVVLARGESGDKRLVAYIEAAAARPSAGELRAHLKVRLPEYMIPSAFALLDALPVTPNGKVDRRAVAALPEEETTGRAEGYQPPRGATEEILAGMWARLLSVRQVGAHDNFFELGGHSLLATRAVSWVREAFGVELALRSLFELPTVAGLADLIDRELRRGGGLAAPPLLPRERGEAPPLSFAQQRLWFFSQLEPDNPVLNIAAALRLRGGLDRDALARALDEIVRRHEVLRTRFRSVGGHPSQEIATALTLELPLTDLSALAEEVREDEARRLLQAEARVPFDLAADPVLRARLLQLSCDEHIALLTIHHIAADRWSLGVLVGELAALYEAFAAGRPSPLPELPVQYADFAIWQREWLRGEVLDAQLDYWRRQLAGAPPLLALPLDRPRPAVQRARGERHRFMLDAEFGSRLKSLAQGEQVTLFMLLLAAFQTLLSYLTGKEDIVVGTDVAGRNRAETEGLIGFFVNQLVLRTRVEPVASFRRLLREVRETALAAYAHQDLPFEKLVEVLSPARDPGHRPIFQVKMNVQNVEVPTPTVHGLTLSAVSVGNDVLDLDLMLVFAEAHEGLGGWLHYNTDLFEARTAARIVSRLETLLREVATDPEVSVADLLRTLAELDRRDELSRRREREESRRDKFARVKPVAVSLPRAEVVKTSYLREGQTLPLVVGPAAEGIRLADWAGGNGEWVADRLAEHGVILFRGFGVSGAAEFERFAGALSRRLLDGNGEHQRTPISDHVYTPVFYPAGQQLLWHNENSFNHEWPSRIWFCCLKPAAAGGETPVVDSRRVYERIAPEVREQFLRRGVMYVRNYGTGVGLDWQTVFRTRSRAEVEERCRREGMRYEWKDGDRLRTSCVRPAAVRHQRTGEPVWFNQAQHWHVSCLDAETRQSVLCLFAEEDMPRQCYYGDGGPIRDEEMAEVLRAYAELEVSFPWEAGDVLMVDNLLAAHGRNRFEGERKLLVTMGDVLSYDDVETV